MNHLDMHPHAYINEDNLVIDVNLFNESDHDSQLLEDLLSVKKAKQVVCCCTFGIARVGDTWTGTEFRYPAPGINLVWDTNTKEWVPPTPAPTDGPLYQWDLPSGSWKEVDNTGYWDLKTMTWVPESE